MTAVSDGRQSESIFGSWVTLYIVSGSSGSWSWHGHSSTDAEGSHPNPFTPLASHYPELR